MAVPAHLDALPIPHLSFRTYTALSRDKGGVVMGGPVAGYGCGCGGGYGAGGGFALLIVLFILLIIIGAVIW